MKSKRRSQRSTIKRLVHGKWGQWEHRSVSVAHPKRPLLSQGERWLESNYVNGRYSVQVSELDTAWGLMAHLWIKRHDDGKVIAWASLQRIKDELFNPEATAVEVFPARSQLVDQANMFHLWVLPADFQLPFTLRGSKT